MTQLTDSAGLNVRFATRSGPVHQMPGLHT